MQRGQQLILSFHSPFPLSYLLAKSSFVLKKETITPEHLKATFSAAALFYILFTASNFCMVPSGLYLLPTSSSFAISQVPAHIFLLFMNNQQIFSFTNTAQHSYILFLAQTGY